MELMSSPWWIPPPYPFPEQWARVQRRQQRGELVGAWLSPFTPLSQLVARACPPPAPPQQNQYHSNGSSTTTPYDGHYYNYDYHNTTSPYTTGVYDSQEYGDNREMEENGEEEDDEDDEYEYGYVLRDEWRTYLRENVLSEGEEEEGSESSSTVAARASRRQRQQQKRTQQRKTAEKSRSQSRAKPTPSVNPLALALHDAETLERRRRRERLDGQDEGDAKAALQRVEALETALHSRFDAFCDRHAPTVWPQGAS